MGKGCDTLELLPPAQAFLFEGFEDEPRLVNKVREYIHNGKRALRDDARCQAIVSAILNGAPKMAVMKHFRVGHETLTAIYEVFEQAGRVRSLKEAQLAGWQSILVLSQWRIQEKLINDEMPAQVLGMLGGISHDKLEGMTHSGAEEGGQKRSARADVEATIAELRRLLRPASDSESGALAVQCVEVKACEPVSACSDGELATGPRPGDAPAAEGGGGDRPPRAPLEREGLGRQILDGKEGPEQPSDGSGQPDGCPGIPPAVKEGEEGSIL